jgi:uncharacterized protein DUF6252
MKRLPFLLFIVVVLISFRCKKEKTPEEQLPPETQTGAGTFGCLIDGKIFKPKGDPLTGPVLRCAYQNIDGGFYFQLKASNKGDINYNIGIFTDSLKIQQGITLVLKNQNVPGEAYGLYTVSKIQGSTEYQTNATDTGEIAIKKLDEINRIVSGTFWFDAINSLGQKVKVREGRFDLKYSL